MDQFRRVLTTIQTQLARLTVSQRLLIGTLAVVVAMSLFLVSQYAGRADLVKLLPGATAEEQQRAMAYLQGIGHTVELRGGEVYIAGGSQYTALAQLQQNRKMPDDKKQLFRNLAEQQNWMMPKSQLDQLYTTALQNELAQIIASFPGIEEASVFISSPPPSGLGAPARRPSAAVTVHTRADAGLTPDMVDSIAELVSGSTAGLEPGEVKIADSAKGRRYRPRTAEDFSASSYLEHANKVEDRIQNKLRDSLSYIEDVIVSVNAQVDVVKKTTHRQEVLPKGKGTESLVASETSSVNTQAQATQGGSPGLQSNVGMSINSGGGGGTTSSEETTETTMATEFGRVETKEVDPSGRPTRVNVAIGVPMSWVAQIVRERKASAGGGGGAGATEEPTDKEIDAAWEVERGRLTDFLQPLVETAAAAEGQDSGKVVVSMIPVLRMAGSGPARAGILGGGLGGGGSGSGGGAMGVIGSLAKGPLLKTVLLGGLAVVALGMMVVMVRKSARPEPLPTAEELAGVPPKLQTETDLVGEASEGDTAMVGIEIDDDSLRSKKMLEQVSDLIKKNPGEAATVFNRWLQTET